MGTDLMLKYKDEIIASLGRAYHFEDLSTSSRVIETDHEKIIDQTTSRIEGLKKKMIALAAYKNPESVDEVDEIIENIEVMFEDLMLMLISAGKKLMLADILEDKDFSIEKK